MPTYPKRQDGLVDRTIDGERVLLDSERKLIHKLNPTASLVWDRCDGDTAVDEICEQLVAEFGRPREEIESDVLTLIGRLRDLGVLDPGGSES